MRPRVQPPVPGGREGKVKHCVAFRISFPWKGCQLPQYLAGVSKALSWVLISLLTGPLSCLLNAHSFMQRHLLPLPGGTAEFTVVGWSHISFLLHHSWYPGQDLAQSRNPVLLAEGLLCASGQKPLNQFNV
jgi:hypothetical protein